MALRAPSGPSCLTCCRRCACRDAPHARAAYSVARPRQDEAARVVKFVHLEDRKRALVSQLLQRASCERALGVPFQEVVLSRTKGGKPFLVRGLGFS